MSFQGARRRARLRLLSAPEIRLTLSEPSAADGRAVKPGENIQGALDAAAVHVIADTTEPG